MKEHLLWSLLLWVPSDGSTQDLRKLVAETNHSTLQFSVPISDGITRITGKFNDFSIELEMHNQDILTAKISAIIKPGSINTGIPARDEDLKSSDFFDVEKYPEITFISQRIEKAGDSYVAHGQFHMHGVEKSISLPFRITARKNDDVIGFSSRFTIRRSDFGVGTDWKHTTDDRFIADEIGVELDFWTKKPRK